MNKKPLEDYTLNDLRELRKGVVLIGLATLAVMGLAVFIIAYMNSHDVPPSKIHSFSMLCTAAFIVMFWAIISPKSFTITKLLKLHPEWKKEKFMGAKLGSATLIQLIAAPAVLLALILIGFTQFNQPEKAIPRNQPSMSLPESAPDAEFDTSETASSIEQE